MSTKGHRTRQDITEKAFRLFSVRGYSNTSISDILEATGLTKGGLYGHFRSKEDIWYAVYDKAVAGWKDIVFKDMRKVSDPLERVKKTIENDLKHYKGSESFAGG